jgi:tellurite resistance protein
MLRIIEEWKGAVAMFLAELQSCEKKAFMELAALIAQVDGNLSIFEHSILEKYKKEAGLEDYQVEGLEMDDILKFFQSERSKNIVLTEILKLIYSDGVFHNQERESIRLIKEHFGFNPDEYGSFKDWISKIKELSEGVRNS